MYRLFSVLLLSCLALWAKAGQTLDIYFIDVEGGQSTLIVTPSGQSMLVDTGWPGNNGRDADRIVAAAKQAGVKQIDYLVATHYHTDHIGGVPQLAERMPIIHFIDHGPDSESDEALFEPYARLREKGQHVVVKPGDHIPLEGVTVQVVSSDGQVLRRTSAQPNALCQKENLRAEDRSENARSVGFLLRFGQFSFLDLGDLTWNKELELACPANVIGTISVYLVTHHGSDLSGPSALVHALRPQVAIMNNGAKKGGSRQAWQIVKESPGLDDLWQLHVSEEGGKQYNSPDKYVANVEGEGEGHWLKLSAHSDGSFSVTNSRSGFTKGYHPLQEVRSAK